MKQLLTISSLFLTTTIFSQSPRLLLPVGQTEYQTTYSGFSFSPDSKLFVTTSYDNFYVWNRSAGALLYSYPKTSSSRIQMSPDGKYIISNEGENTILTDSRTGKQETILKFSSHYTVSGFSNDGKYILVVTARDSIDLYSYPGYKFNQRIPGSLSNILFTNDGKYVISTDGTRFFKWDLENKKMDQTVNIEKYYIVSMSPYSSYLISPDGNHIAARKIDSIFVWDIKNNAAPKIFTGDWSGFGTFEFSADGNSVMSMGDDGNLTTFDISSGVTSHKYFLAPSFTSRIYCLLSADRKTIAISHLNTIGIYDVMSGKRIDSLYFDLQANEIGKQYYSLINFSPDGKNLAITHGDQLIFYSIGSNQLIRTQIWYNKIVKTVVCPGNQWLLTNTEDTATLWDTRSWKPVAQMEIGRSNFDCVFNDNGNRLMMWDGRDFAIFSIPDGKKIFKIKNPFKGKIEQPFISGDGSKIALVGLNLIYIWDVATAKNISKISRSFSYQYDHLSFSYDGNYFLTAKNDSILVIRTTNGAIVNKMIRDKTDSVYTFIYMSPGEKYMMTHNANHRGATIWEIASGKKLYRLEDMDPQFTKDGNYIVAGQAVYNIKNGKLVERVVNPNDKYVLARADVDKFYLSLNDIGKSGKNGVRVEGSHGGRSFNILPIEGNNFLIYDEFGHYDGSEQARALLNLACNDNVISDRKELEKLYVPGLAEKIMKGDKIKEKKVSELDCK